MAEKKLKEIGKIIHYFDNVGVAVVSLSDKLKVGDTIRIIGGESTDFSQKIDSMEVDHEKIKQGKKGDEIGMKIKEKVRSGYRVYLE
ncbi:MAG: hypothetical protein ABID67_02715 [Candidatus Nealsonbacteria bacterium]